MENKNCNKLLEKMFWDLLESDLYKNSSERKEMDRITLEQNDLIEKSVPHDIYAQIERYISISELNNEKYGFILGFKYAIHLMDECRTF